tara:strand:+ start:288 stop:674 length:387 start_codon:yes stop_codon:yes gene_type:complete
MISNKITEKIPKSEIIVHLAVAVILTMMLSALYILGKVNQDNFRFEVTNAKRCEGGPYMTQSGPDHDMCKKLLSTPKGQNKYDMFNCSGEYNGRPLNFGPLTPLSNDKWENTSCDKPQTINNWTPIPL